MGLPEYKAPEGFAEKIRAERRRLSMTKVQFGKLVGVTAMTVGRWEKGIHRVTLTALEKLVSATGQPMEHWTGEANTAQRRTYRRQRTEIQKTLDRVLILGERHGKQWTALVAFLDALDQDWSDRP